MAPYVSWSHMADAVLRTWPTRDQLLKMFREAAKCAAVPCRCSSSWSPRLGYLMMIWPWGHVTFVMWIWIQEYIDMCSSNIYYEMFFFSYLEHWHQSIGGRPGEQIDLEIRYGKPEVYSMGNTIEMGNKMGLFSGVIKHGVLENGYRWLSELEASFSNRGFSTAMFDDAKGYIPFKSH